GQVVSDDAILSAIGGGRHFTVKRMFVEQLHRVGGIAGLQIREWVAICDDILEGFDGSNVCRRVGDVAASAFGQRAPDFGGCGECSANAVLACQVEVGERSWTTRWRACS